MEMIAQPLVDDAPDAAPAPRISIVIPAYNEQGIIGPVLDQLRGRYHEIIVVDDGSTDGTPEEAEAHGARVVRHPYNIGNGAAIKSGVRAATGEIIVLMDGDGQHPPADVPRLLSHLGAFDMVVGARLAGTTWQWHRKLANRVFNAYASYVVDHDVLDLTSGFRVFRAAEVRKLLYLLPNRYSSPTTLTIAMFRSGYKVHYEPIASPAREGKSSKIRPLRDGFRFLLTITRIGAFFVPMKVFLPVSLTFFSVGMVYSAYLLIVDHRFSNMAALLIMTSVMIFLIGLVAEQLALLRLQNLSE